MWIKFNKWRNNEKYEWKYAYVIVDNNLSNKTNNLSISLDMNTDSILISKDFNKDNNLNIFKRKRR